jgi:hypothetical protein
LAEEQQLWLGRGGQRFGPYREAVVRQWLAEGKVEWSTLAWCHGMPEWRSLSEVLQTETAWSAPPPPPPGLSPDTYARMPDDVGMRRRLPDPPSMHWFAVMLLSIVTLGIFGIVWAFIQASWVRKADPTSKAGTWLATALVCVGLSWVAQIALRMAGVANATPVFFGYIAVVSVFSLGSAVFAYMGYFSMANSMRRVLPSYGISPEIGGVTLFFFTKFYLQGQMSWVARWKETGSTTPPAPKAIFWCLWAIFPVGLAVLAAIAIPAYQDYLVRSQVLDGMNVSARAREAVVIYYRSHQALPADNGEAGLPPPADMRDRLVSQVAVAQGRVAVMFDGASGVSQLRGKTLVLSPYRQNGAVAWRCTVGAEVRERQIPESCR